MGETASPPLLQQVVEIVKANDIVENVQQPLSMVLGPEDVLLILKPVVKQDLSSAQIVNAIENIKAMIREKHSMIKQVYIEPMIVDESKLT